MMPQLVEEFVLFELYFGGRVSKGVREENFYKVKGELFTVLGIIFKPEHLEKYDRRVVLDNL